MRTIIINDVTELPLELFSSNSSRNCSSRQKQNFKTVFIDQFPELQFHAMCNFVFVPFFNFVGTPVLRTPVLRKIWSKVVFQNVFPRTAVLERLFKKEKINESSKFNSSKSTMNSPKMTHFEKFKKCGKYKKREN